MNIIVHRGTNQIGGCVTEIQTEKTRIFIDMGSELPDENGVSLKETLSIEGVTRGGRQCDGVFFTHYHSDHIGMLPYILPVAPCFMGPAAKEIFLELQKHVNPGLVPAIEAIMTFQAGEKMTVGDITVTPFMVDHSAYDSYMFLIEAEGKRILHTGDFRTHGFRGKGVIPMLKKYVGQVDVLITEGTTLSRDEAQTMTEYELQKNAKKMLAAYKYVFVFCSSTNIDRIALFHEATPRGKYFLCDSYQKNVIEIARKYGAEHTPLYTFKKALIYNSSLMGRYEKRGFCMMVRGNARFQEFIEHYRVLNNPESLVIYSMWDGYLNYKENKIIPIVDGFQNAIHLHTSGHATKNAIKDVCNAVCPKQAIIPIHSTNSTLMDGFNMPFHVEHLIDGQVYKIR